MNKGRKRCYFCGYGINNQNRNRVRKQTDHIGLFWIWVDACHGCAAKENKKP